MSADLSPLKGRVAVVTGATRGLGHALTLCLSMAGAHVLAVGRYTAALEALDDDARAAGGESLTLVPLDLTDGAGIDRLGAAIHERWGRLDILAGIAAVLGQVSPLAQMPVKAFQPAMDVNVTANWRLIRTLHPVLRASDAGRAVFATCAAAGMIKAGWGAYGASKAALEVLTQTYAREVERTPIRVNLIDPGPMATGLRAAAAPGEDRSLLPHPRDIAPAVAALCMPEELRHGERIELAR